MQNVHLGIILSQQLCVLLLYLFSIFPSYSKGINWSLSGGSNVEVILPQLQTTYFLVSFHPLSIYVVGRGFCIDRNKHP